MTLDQQIKQIIDLTDKISTQTHDINCNLYRANLEVMSDEELCCHWCEVIGDEMEFYSLMDKRGRAFVEWRMNDTYEVSSAVKLGLIN